MIDIYTYPQLSDAWFKIKLGVISASHFSDVLAGGSGKTRYGYMKRLCGEILTGIHRETYCNADMRRGIEQEPAARKEYEFFTGNSVDQIGFAINNNVGNSPDGLVGNYGLIEIKCVIPSVQVETLLQNDMPTAYKAQVQGAMLVMECGWCDFVSYSPDMDRYLFIKRIHRDGLYVIKLQEAIGLFYRELMEMVAEIRSK
jgi:hypothetical protein